MTISTKTVAPSGLFISPRSYVLRPLIEEFKRTGIMHHQRSANELVMARLKTEAHVSLAMCSSDQLINNIGIDMALPIGLVVREACGLAYFVSDRSDEIREALQPRIKAIGALFESLAPHKTENMRAVADAIWEALPELPVADLKHVPHVRFCQQGTGFAALGRIMYRLLFGEAACEANHLLQSRKELCEQDSEACLALHQGNKGLLNRCQYRRGINLLSLWNDWTKLPFVASVMQRSKRSCLNYSQTAVLKAAELAQVKMKVEPCTYFPDLIPKNSYGQALDLAGLWKHISYRLRPEDFKSLLLFLNLDRHLDKHLDSQSVNLKLLRWQQKDLADKLLNF